MQHRLGCLAVPHVMYLAFQARAVAQHRRDAQARELLGVIQRWMDEDDRAGVLIHDVAQGVKLHLCLADLRRSHDDYLAHLGVAECPHRLAHVGRSARPPRTGFGGAFGGQSAVSVRPLVHADVLGRLEVAHRAGDRAVQITYRLIPRLHRSPRSIPSARAPSAHRPRGRIRIRSSCRAPGSSPPVAAR